MPEIEKLQILGHPVLYRPAAVAESTRGTLILLHGYGADEYDLMGLTPYFDPNFHIVSIRGPGKTPFGGACWFDIDMNADGSLRFNFEQALRSSEAVQQIIFELKAREALNSGKLILGGFSQGATISNLLALTSPKILDGLLIMSGRLDQTARQLLRDVDEVSNLPVFAAHGTLDQVIPVNFGRDLVAFWSTLPVQLEHHEYNMAHEISQEELVHITQWLAVHFS